MHQELSSGRWPPPVRLPAVDVKPPPLPEVVLVQFANAI